jgi:hypothetical protein
MSEFFTDREYGPTPRHTETIGEPLWLAIRSMIDLKTDNGSFGYRFPAICTDPGRQPYGCDERAFGAMLVAEVPWLEWPLRRNELPATPVILDLLEFCAMAVGEMHKRSWHDFMDHYHVYWDREVGMSAFVVEVNRLLARNGIAYEMSTQGKIRRILPDPLAQAIAQARFATGDDETDRLLEAARTKILAPKHDDRSDGLEKLWDAFERIKTLDGSDKKLSAAVLLDRAVRPGTKLRASIEEEAMALTRLGNTHRIRHSETSQEPLETALQIDYLFTRLFAFLHFVLKASNRAT